MSQEIIKNKIEIKPIGVVKRIELGESVKDRSLPVKIVVNENMTQGLDGIEKWSHIYILFWMHEISNNEIPDSGTFVYRSPIRPNPIGLTLVELMKHEKNIIWVRGLDAYDGTPVLDIKPFPDWENGKWLVVHEFRAPEWLLKINDL